ncbi:MAG: LuxR C-terminal-related transcriptional regulator, partial [Terracoccus sp.]
AGVLDLAEADGSYWFHHPLQAEVLVRHVPLDERRRWHEVFAGHFEAALQADDDAELLALVAEHHFLADHQEEAYRWCIRAADGMVSRSPERLRLLQRAVDLRPLVPHDRLSRADLLWLLKDTAESAAALRVELDAVDELLTELDRSSDSARCAELMVRRMYLRFSLGLGFITRAQADEAAQVGSGATDSWQYALAAAAQAHAAMWEGASDAHDLADRAVALATSAGHPRARSYACTAMSSIMLDHDPEAAETWASRGREFALESGDFWAYTHAVMWECNAVDVWTAPQTLDLVARRRLEAQAAGAPQHYLAWLANAEAGGRLAAGRWREAAELLRLSLGSEPGPVVDVNARLHSGRLAALQGRPDEATAHLDRVRELIADPSAFKSLPYDAIHAEVLLAAGDPTGALEVVQGAVSLPGVAPTNCEWLLPVGARALADQVELARGRGSGRRRDESEVLLRLKELDDLVRRFPGAVPDIGVPMSFVRHSFDATLFHRSQLEAFDAWYRAEVGRAHRRPSNLDEWARAATLLSSAGLPWEAAYAGWRAAQACLLGARPDRSRAATWLRRSAALAEDLRALPVLDEVRALARAARIRLERVDLPAAGPLVDTLGLTPREREVLAHVAAGRTYAEIATALVLSEKTVSSHISHMLSKTGTANRVELAALSREGE